MKLNHEGEIEECFMSGFLFGRKCNKPVVVTDVVDDENVNYVVEVK